MTLPFTQAQLHQRWEQALILTDKAVRRQPGAYRELKSMVLDILGGPLDIGDYVPTARKLVSLLDQLDPGFDGTIFSLSRESFEPTSVWHVKFLRLECSNLLEHLREFEGWRLERHRLKIIR